MMMMMFMNWECFFLLRYDMIQATLEGDFFFLLKNEINVSNLRTGPLVRGLHALTRTLSMWFLRQATARPSAILRRHVSGDPSLLTGCLHQVARPRCRTVCLSRMLLGCAGIWPDGRARHGRADRVGQGGRTACCFAVLSERMRLYGSVGKVQAIRVCKLFSQMRRRGHSSHASLQKRVQDLPRNVPIRTDHSSAGGTAGARRLLKTRQQRGNSGPHGGTRI